MSARDPLAEVIWNASRADEDTISAIGAEHVAAAVRAFLASDETVERAAAGIAEWRRYGGMAGDTADEQRARAALSAATEARP